MQRLLSMAIATAMATSAWAGTSAMVRSTVAAGGGASSGASYTLTGVVGQWNAHEASVGGSWSLTGGFWGPGNTVSCPADLNGDGVVAGGDLAELLASWGLGGPADFDGSGVVDGSDLASLLAAWGPCS